MAFRPALVVVDMQNDFCPPDGSLAVQGGHDIVPLINNLLACSTFVVKVATKDWHPEDHVSFATNHPPPNNKPFESFVQITNVIANKPHETFQQRLWPVHCVQHSKGADFVEELDVGNIDLTVLKGLDPRVEMYSAFSDAFGNMTAGAGGVSHDLARVLQEKDVTHVYIVGLAGDYCVKDTALGAARGGFKTFVLEEAQRCVDPEAWSKVKAELAQQSVKVVNLDDDEIKVLGAVQL